MTSPKGNYGKEDDFEHSALGITRSENWRTATDITIFCKQGVFV